MLILKPTHENCTTFKKRTKYKTSNNTNKTVEKSVFYTRFCCRSMFLSPLFSFIHNCHIKRQVLALSPSLRLLQVTRWLISPIGLVSSANVTTLTDCWLEVQLLALGGEEAEEKNAALRRAGTDDCGGRRRRVCPTCAFCCHTGSLWLMAELNDCTFSFHNVQEASRDHWRQWRVLSSNPFHLTLDCFPFFFLSSIKTAALIVSLCLCGGHQTLGQSQCWEPLNSNDEMKGLINKILQLISFHATRWKGSNVTNIITQHHDSRQCKPWSFKVMRSYKCEEKQEVKFPLLPLKPAPIQTVSPTDWLVSSQLESRPKMKSKT